MPPLNTINYVARCSESEFSEQERQTVEMERADRSLFVQELLLSTLAAGLRLDSDDSPVSVSPPQDMLPALPDSGPSTLAAPPVESTTAADTPAPSSSDHCVEAAESSEDVASVTTETAARTPVGKTASSHRNKVRHLDGVKNSGLSVMKH